MITRKVFEALQPYLEVVDANFDPNWYRPKEGFVIILSAVRNVPLYLESVTVEETQIRFSTTDMAECDEPDIYTYNLDAPMYLNFKVHALSEPVLVIEDML